MILVTGATGRVASKLVESLLSSGKQVRALARNPQKAASLKAATPIFDLAATPQGSV